MCAATGKGVQVGVFRRGTAASPPQQSGGQGVIASRGRHVPEELPGLPWRDFGIEAARPKGELEILVPGLESVIGARRAKAALSSWCQADPATAPAGMPQRREMLGWGECQMEHRHVEQISRHHCHHQHRYRKNLFHVVDLDRRGAIVLRQLAVTRPSKRGLPQRRRAFTFTAASVASEHGRTFPVSDGSTW
jgi:hypothetical protein